MLKEWYWKYLEIDKWIHFKSERKVNEIKIKDNREESVTSRYHGSKISGWQQ